MVNATLQPYDYRLGKHSKKTIAKQQSNTNNKNHMECVNYIASDVVCDNNYRFRILSRHSSKQRGWQVLCKPCYQRKLPQKYRAKEFIKLHIL